MFMDFCGETSGKAKKTEKGKIRLRWRLGVISYAVTYLFVA
jgi:hypothetical protein